MQSIIDKSSGVFLWVVLACRSLLIGCADHDRLTELRRRVDELPPELESMFQLLLGKIKGHHREPGSQLLRICYTHQSAPWPNASEALRALGLSMIDNYHGSSVAIKPLTEEAKYELRVELEGRLRSRTGGLLELQKPNTAGTAPQHQAKLNTYIDANILFMHRTVYEFLNNEEAWKLNCLKISDKMLNAATALSLYGLYLSAETFYLTRYSAS
jgi:hypothetical protein